MIAVDLSDDKLAFALRLGATHTVNARSDDAVAEIDLPGGHYRTDIAAATGMMSK